MDFDKIIRNAFMHENFKNLNAYFEREFKKAQRDNFYEKDDFFNPILDKLERIEKLNNDAFEKLKLSLKIGIEKAQKNEFEHKDYYSMCLDRLGVLYESYKQEQNDLRVKDFTKQLENLSIENFKRKDIFDNYSNSEIDSIRNAVNNISFKKIEQPELNESKTSHELREKKYFAKHYVLAYLIECNAKGESFPIGQKLELEKIGNRIMGTNKGNRFYKVFNDIINKDLNIEKNLIEIGGENWRTKIKDLSSEPETIEKYLQSKQL